MVKWPMTSREPKRSNSWPQNVWSPVSPYSCKIGAWSSLTTNRKVLTPSPMVTWPMTSRDLKRSRSWPQNLWSPVSPYPRKIGAWSSLTTNRKVPRRVLWSRDRWRHVTHKDQNRDPKIFKVRSGGHMYKSSQSKTESNEFDEREYLQNSLFTIWACNKIQYPGNIEILAWKPAGR